MMADLLAPPTAAEFLDDAAARLDRLTRTLSSCRWEDVDTVAAVRELHRILAQHNAALRLIAGAATTDTRTAQEA